MDCVVRRISAPRKHRKFRTGSEVPQDKVSKLLCCGGVRRHVIRKTHLNVEVQPTRGFRYSGCRREKRRRHHDWRCQRNGGGCSRGRVGPWLGCDADEEVKHRFRCWAPRVRRSVRRCGDGFTSKKPRRHREPRIWGGIFLQIGRLRIVVVACAAAGRRFDIMPMICSRRSARRRVGMIHAESPRLLISPVSVLNQPTYRPPHGHDPDRSQRDDKAKPRDSSSSVRKFPLIHTELVHSTASRAKHRAKDSIGRTRRIAASGIKNDRRIASAATRGEKRRAANLDPPPSTGTPEALPRRCRFHLLWRRPMSR